MSLRREHDRQPDQPAAQKAACSGGERNCGDALRFNAGRQARIKLS
jgi:hypothetical protein